MDKKTRIIVDHIKEEFSKQGRMMRQINKMVPIQGERRVIPLADRNIDVAYYSVKKEHAPLLIGLHGGGFVFGGSALDDDMWVAIRDALDVNVVSIEYRKCPDYRWPAPVDDVYECACYLKEHADEYGFDPEEMSVIGFSAGANLAATACLKAKQMGVELYRYQLLIYPFLDMVTPPNEKGDEGCFEPEGLIAFNELYTEPEDRSNILASPVFATKEELEGLPEAVIVLAQKDELQHEGRKYAQMLEEAGVKVTQTLIKDMPHAYFENGYIKDTKGRELNDWTLKCLADGTMQQACADTLAFVKTVYSGEGK